MVAIPQATLYMDGGAHSLKSGLPGVKGHTDICCVCGQCAQALSHTRHWKPFDMTTFRCWPLVLCTPNRVFLSSKERKKGAADISSNSQKPPIASDAKFSQAASEVDLWRRCRNPVRKCGVALKGTIYKEEGSARDSDAGSNEVLPSMPTQRTTPKVTIGSNSSSSSSSNSSSNSSSSSSSSSASSSSSGTSSESVNGSDGEDVASVIYLDEAGWSHLSPAVHMLSQLEEFELQD